jgi:hypothetical protein
MWIKTEGIEVPAHKDQTTEVSINEWFTNNHSFLLGTPVASQLRGTSGGWAQTVAVEAEPGQNTIALLQNRLQTILKRAKVDAQRKKIIIPVQHFDNGKPCTDIQPTEVEAEVFDGVLAVHRHYNSDEESDYRITHVLTGLAVGSGRYSEMEARDRVVDLLLLPMDWTFTSAADFPIKYKNRVAKIMQGDYLSTSFKAQMLGKGDDATPPSPDDTGKVSTTHEDSNTMATVIPADRFESDSAYAFILRENPKASGIEIQFPLDCTQTEWPGERRWSTTERNTIRDRIAQATAGFISVIEKEGFQQANGNPFLWWIKATDSGVFTQKMSKARSWVTKCSRWGAYELDASIPVDQTKTRRRNKPPVPSPQSELTPNSPSPQPASGNKLADALSEAIAPRLAAALLPQIVEVVGASQQTKELEREVERLKMQVEELQQLRTKYEVENMKLANERDGALAKLEHMEGAVQELNTEVEKFRDMAMELERDRDSLKLTLADLGLDSDVVQPAPAVNWESEPDEAPSWDEFTPSSEVVQPAPTMNWEDEALGESESNSNSVSEPEDTEESEGFDLDSLGE